MKKATAIFIILFLSLPIAARDFKETQEIINTILSEGKQSAGKSDPEKKEKEPQEKSADAEKAGKKEEKSPREKSKKKEKETLTMSQPDEVLMKTGVQFYNSGLYPFSLKQFSELQSKHPQSQFKDIARIFSGKIQMKLYKYDKAIEEFSAVQNSSVEYPGALFYTGESIAMKGNALSSIEYFQKVASQFPSHELADDALLKIGKLYLKNSNGQQALDATLTLIKYYKTRETIDEAYYLLGVIFMKDPVLKDVETARRVYKVFIQKVRSGEQHFAKSPLRFRVQDDLSRIEKTHFKLEQ